MPHVFEIAPTGRSKCRACAKVIEKGARRFGERLPNPFAEGDMTLWFHPDCAAYKRPEPLLAALGETTEDIADRDQLERTAQTSIQHRRLPRIDGAERAPSAQAKCRHCRQPIERGAWRIRLVFYEDGRFSGGGSVHVECRKDYFETNDVVAERVLHFSSNLIENELNDLKRALEFPLPA